MISVNVPVPSLVTDMCLKQVCFKMTRNEPVMAEKVVAYSKLGRLARCYLKTIVLFRWLVTRTLQCIPMHHKVSSYGGMISDILTLC